MSIFKIIWLFIFFQITGESLVAQKVVDSISVCQYPVKEGTIYRYDRSKLDWSISCGGQGFSILTKYDSVFNLGKGEVIGVHFYGDSDRRVYVVVIKVENDEFVTYSNLKTINLCKGDDVQKGSFLGLAGPSDDGNYQQVNFMLFNRDNHLPFKKEVESIRCNSSCDQMEYGPL